jgi:membrane-associated protease RseP (regulator of RpoE activity)
VPPPPAATAEIPTTDTPTAETPTTAAVPTATPPGRSKGVMVPWWALAVVAALVVFGGGYLIGHAVGDDGHDGRASARFVGPGGGSFGRGELPNPFGGNGNGGGNTNPFGGNGNGGNGNGNGGNGGGNGGTSPSTQSTAFLGVGVADAANGGVRVTTVVGGGPASDAGLSQGDVITAVDGTKVADAAALRSAISDHEPGDTVKVTYTRGGAAKTVSVTLGDRNATSQ